MRYSPVDPRPGPGKFRAFLALELSGEMREGVGALKTRLEKGAAFTGARVVWTSIDSIHLTIKFLGNIEESMAPRIAERLKPACASIAPFVFGARGLGVFPTAYRPSIIWVGVKKADAELTRLHATVERALSSFGFDPEERPYHPHLTIARLKSSKARLSLMNLVEQFGRDWCGSTTASRLVLFRSVMNKEGATHTPMLEFPFLAPPVPAAPDLPAAPELPAAPKRAAKPESR